jgi:antagonist of KipI
MSIQILKSGILTSVQDLGRRNFRRFGINPNGVMDAAATRLINVLLGNDENEAVLEMHFPAAEILFEENAFFAVGGADFSARLGDAATENWRPFYAEKGSVLRFAEKKSGSRAYFSVKGGFAVEKWLGSAATNLKAGIGGFDGRSLRQNDRLHFRRPAAAKIEQRISFKISAGLLPFYSRFPAVRVVEGAEFGLLTAGGRETFLHEDFTVSHDSDRMGFRLSGTPLRAAEKKEIISSAVNFGTVQLLPDGQLIILMADHQTSGGYPRLANVISVDRPLLGQLGEGDKAAFHRVTLAEAENLQIEFEKNLNLLKIAVNQKV